MKVCVLSLYLSTISSITASHVVVLKQPHKELLTVMVWRLTSGEKTEVMLHQSIITKIQKSISTFVQENGLVETHPISLAKKVSGIFHEVLTSQSKKTVEAIMIKNQILGFLIQHGVYDEDKENQNIAAQEVVSTIETILS